MNCSLPGSSDHGIFQARVLEWVAISFSRGSASPRDQTLVSCIIDRCFAIWATREDPFLSYLFNHHLVCWPCLNTQYRRAPLASPSFIPGFIFFIESAISGYSLYIFIWILSFIFLGMWGICFSVSLFIPSMCLKYVDSQYTLLKVMKEFLIRTVHIVLTKKKKKFLHFFK